MNRFFAGLSVMVLLLSLPIFGASPLPASTLSLEASAMSQSGSGFSIYLPAVANSFRPRPPCTPDSPFTIQIAALHMITGPAGAAIAGGMSRAEWKAWIDEIFPDLVQALEESGACWARVRLDWDHYESDPAWFDDKLGLVADAGLQMIAVIDDVPEWARGEPYPDYQCTHVAEDTDPPDEFADFIAGLANHFKEPPWNIHVWEFRNEPDGVDPEELDWQGQGCGGERADLYVDNLQRAHDAIKAADPAAKVLMGGMAYDRFTEYGGAFNRYFPDDVMANGGAEYLDALNVHYFPDFYAEWERWLYGNPDYPEAEPPTCGVVDDGAGDPYEAWGIDVIAKIKHLRNRMDTCFDVQKPIWVTELGEHGDPDVAGSLDQQSRYVIQGIVRSLAAGAENVTWFALIAPEYDDFQQGLLYEDMSPKPAFYTYQTLTTELYGFTYAYTRDVTDVEAYVFTDSRGREKTVAWGAGDPGSRSLAFPGKSQLRIVDREGNISHVLDGGSGDMDGSQNGSITLQLPPVPVDPDPGNPPRLTADPLIISD